MRIPKKVHFAGRDYKITEVAKLDGEVNWGRTMVDEGTIHLEKTMPTQLKEQVFIHELMHIAYKHTFSEIDQEKEEKTIKAFARNIYGILKDNDLLK